ncbi:uncharacterized protein LOC143298604 [Babylonia areolata]|uniref:uncharacterized protein LOC143298604 n=1 Tax=Babylonia areolata TaxID=304850 RepID=UPI003FD59202
MKFVRRSNNVVQVYEGPVSDSNNDHLCDDDNLVLDEWPWVAPWLNRPYYCPIEGGFTFRTIRRLTHEDFCEKEWRRSHLEIECVRGDGLHFMAPANSKCNPFEKDNHITTLNCWAGWEEGDYIFLVAADRNEPRYCLRFPKYQAGEFSVLVYFSVICPTENDGKPPHGIEYYELRMKRKDPFSCRDESVLECQAVAANKLCAREEGFSLHCPRSCQLCSPPPEGESPRSRCAFHLRLYGDWVLYEAERTEDVFIDQDSLDFSHLGAFHCHKVLLEDSMFRYKAVSLFRNGCAKRYTCFEFKRRYNNVLQYRVGKSYRRDMEADSMCVFREDPMPLGNRFRSEDFKNLILARDLWPSYCGLKSNIRFNGTVDGEQCVGEIGDYSPDTCTTRGTVILRSDTCASLIIPQEFQCLDFFPADENSEDMKERLITRSMDGKNEYNCWIISSNIYGTRLPQRVMYRMPTPQCAVHKHRGFESLELQAKAVLRLDDTRRGLRLTGPPPQSPAASVKDRRPVVAPLSLSSSVTKR